MDDKIQDFLNCERVAVVGVSPSKMKFGSIAYRELKKKGYTVYPVNPHMEMFDGSRCYCSLVDIEGGVEAALISVKPPRADAVVNDAVQAGIKHLWFQRGADFSGAINKAGDHGIGTVSGKCLLMYAPPVGGIHRIHLFFAKLFKQY